MPGQEIEFLPPEPGKYSVRIALVEGKEYHPLFEDMDRVVLCNVPNSLFTHEDRVVAMDCPEPGFWILNGIQETPCECQVEPDGRCEHGWFGWNQFFE